MQHIQLAFVVVVHMLKKGIFKEKNASCFADF